MAKLIIKGRKKLAGSISSSGAKNAALKMIAASCLTPETVEIENVPQILDIYSMCEILASMDASIVWKSPSKLQINCSNLNPEKINQQKVGKLRGSVVLIGPLLARFKKIRIHEPGGCLIGSRPITGHIEALKQLNVRITKNGKFYTFETDKLEGSNVILNEISVTTTENMIMAATLAQGTTKINLGAIEPEIEALIDFLISMGAKIEGKNTSGITVKGVKKLGSARSVVIPDRIEIGTYVCACAITGGEVTIKNVIPAHIYNLLNKMDRINIEYSFAEKVTPENDKKLNILTIKHSPKLRAIEFDTRPYPGFSTDLQSPMVALLTQAEGKSRIFETMFEGRLKYIHELNQMGAKIETLDRHNIVVNGPSQLYGTTIKSPDLRAGASFIIAGLTAKGTTTVNNAEIIDRGYEKIDKKLATLGADIVREE